MIDNKNINKDLEVVVIKETRPVSNSQKVSSNKQVSFKIEAKVDHKDS